MGLRFRKTFSFGPLRITISKSGISYSFGTKGYRHSELSNGRSRDTFSIPGTGISYVKDKKKKRDR